jgi:hypothetical protein
MIITILNEAPRLHSLTIQLWSHSEAPVIKNTSASLRRLDLRQYSREKYDLSVNEKSRETFIHSPLGMQCAELLIEVQNRETILDLVNGMRNLRFLLIDFYFSADKFYPCQTYSEESQRLIEWLQINLHPTCTISKSIYNSLIWIYLDK